MQKIPANLIAAGYIELRNFFERKCDPGSDGDPRNNPKFLQGHASKNRTLPKQPPKKKNKRSSQPRAPTQRADDVVEVSSGDEDENQPAPHDAAVLAAPAPALVAPPSPEPATLCFCLTCKFWFLTDLNLEELFGCVHPECLLLIFWSADVQDSQPFSNPSSGIHQAKTIYKPLLMMLRLGVSH